ncbi:MAG: FimV family protein, partial [Sinobacterium sp.]|nr:FimV family protein [Sinobacterium sp.]
MNRKLASVILVASAINAKYVYALGLGEMTMHSALNEPLNAEIQLKNVGDLDSTQVIISLAKDAQFNNAGIERTFFLSNIRFAVTIDSEGNGVVKLKSQKRVNEPFLDFLLEAKWPTGRVLRSYTALVDLPVYADADASTVNMSNEQSSKAQQGDMVIANTQTATNTNIAPQETAEKATIEPATEKTAAPKSEVNVAPTQSYAYHQETTSASEYGTKRGDTLWEIASEHRPAADLTVQQIMIAIQRENPKAFIGGNINRLKAGMVLTLPSAQQVYDITRSAAVSEVGRQNQDITYAPQIDATADSTVVEVQSLPEEQGHLSLSASGEGNGNGTAEQGSMSSSEEAALNSENTSLNSQVDSLSTQVSQLERLLEIKEQQLAQFQNSLSESQSADTAAEEVVESTDTVEVSAVGEEPVIVSEVVEDVIVETVIVDENGDVEAVIIEEVIVDEIIVEEAAEEEPASPSIIETLMATPMYLGGIALLIMGLVAGLFIRKRNQSEQAILDSLEEFTFEEAETTEEAAPEPTENAEASVELSDADEDEVAESITEEPVADIVEETSVQTGDAIGEADIYIAYGRFDQASELLQGALAQSPEDVTLRSKLLEVYAQSGDKDGFVAELNTLEAQGEFDAVNAAKELLNAVEGGSSWLSAADSAAVLDQVEALDDLDLDLDLESAFEEDVVEVEPLAELDVEIDNSDASVLDDLDLDLGGELDSADSAESAAVEEVLDTLDDAAEDLSLDLAEADSLDLGDLDLSLGDDDSLDLDLGDSLELDDVALDNVVLDTPESLEEEVLDLGDIDLGLDVSDELVQIEATDNLDLSLGDEVDLSA